MNINSFTVFLIALLFTSASLSAQEVKVKTEQDLASYLESQMNCKKATKDASKGEQSFSCGLKFRGLEMDISGVNSLKGGTIYINSMGKSQLLYPMGARCLVVNFGDPDLVVQGHGEYTSIVFRNDGTVSYLYENSKAAKACNLGQ